MDWRFEDLYTELGIIQVFLSVEHPQTNGLAEVANKIIIFGLKKRFEQAKGPWANELYVLLWAYHTTPYSSTEETLYRLVYRSDDVIPIELTKPRLRTITITKESKSLLGEPSRI